MFLLRLTSDDSLRGIETDDGFIIGRFSGDTVFLLGAGAFVGAFGGLIYLGLREWLPCPLVWLIGRKTLHIISRAFARIA